MFTKFLDKIAKPTATLADVHKEFDTAVDELIRKIEGLSEPNAEEAEVNGVLSAAGFNNVPSVSKMITERGTIKQLRADVECAKRYLQRYPQYKFLTENQLNVICKKYGLVYSIATHFMGEIPIRNKKEIAAFRVQSTDVRENWRGYRSFFVAAPYDQFDSREVRKVEGSYRLSEPDPIVIQPVHGGYLVVTAWGDESKDVASPNRN